MNKGSAFGMRALYDLKKRELIMEKTALYVDELKFNGMKDPVGTSVKQGTLSWKILGEGQNVRQLKCRIQIDTKREFKSPVLENIVNTEIPQWELKGCLMGKTRYFWRVNVCVSTETETEVWIGFSESAEFETALEDGESMGAKWIEADETFYQEAEKLAAEIWKTKTIPEDRQEEKLGLLRIPYMKTIWNLKEKPTKARIYITAHGLYQLHVNGKKIGFYALAPDFTPYQKSIYYQTFDLTEVLVEGENHLQIPLGDGWYVGHSQGIPARNHYYGEHPALIFRAEAAYEDGTEEVLVSDKNMGVYTGPLLYADMFMGESLDMTEVPVKYTAVEKDYDLNVLIPQEYGGIQEKQVLDAVEMHQLSNGAWIVDFGQVMAGHERILFKGEKGSFIKIEFSEMLTPEGDIMIINPLSPFHEQTNYVRIVEDEFLYEPQFSFQGFRYVKVSGTRNELTKEQCKAVVLETAMEDTAFFRCSDERINQLIHNAYWSQCGNMISIPTDCPQRERGGFTGDAQIFCRTAAWNQDVQGFFRRWLKSCRQEQLKRGQIPIVVPYTSSYWLSAPNPGWTSAGWGDAIIFVPQDLYRAYGNKEILEENYEAMERWMEFVIHAAEDDMPERLYFDFPKRRYMKYLWNTGHHWGDWLMPGIPANDGVLLSKERTASLFFYRQVVAMERISRILGKEDREVFYSDLKENIYRCFHIIYVQEDGLLDQELQGLYVMAIAFGMVQGSEKEKCLEKLNELVIQKNYHLATGFLSTPFLLDVLWEGGYRDTAVKLLYQDTCPSWLYEVKQGATTIWEEWEAIREDGSIHATSFNHYAFGCVADFIYRRFTGIEEKEAGLSTIRLYPQFTEGLTHVEFKHQSLFGELEVKWKKTEEGILYQITVPHGMVIELGEDAGLYEQDGSHKKVAAGTEIGSGRWKLIF